MKEKEAAKILIEFLSKQIEDRKLEIKKLIECQKDDANHLNELLDRWS